MGHAEPVLQVEVTYSAAPRQVECVALRLPVHSTVRDALEASGLAQRLGLPVDAMPCGVWGRRCALTQMLRDGDRVELYRPLEVDPKQARRLRYQGARRRKQKSPAGAGR